LQGLFGAMPDGVQEEYKPAAGSMMKRRCGKTDVPLETTIG
jgi:hypothetical protein